MKTMKTLGLGVGAMMLMTAPALAAVTVVNETDQTHTVTFDLGAEEIKHELEPDAKVEEACPTNCGVRFGGHDTIANDGDTLVIKEGETRPVLRQN
ncbi:MAG: hypothetical protein AAF415_18240 [Pseudomonadota bacterium]